MTKMRAEELMENWLHNFLKKEINTEAPCYSWIEENLEAYRLILEALYQLGEKQERTH